MTEWLVLLSLCGVGTLPIESEATACRDKDLVEKFVEYASNAVDLLPHDYVRKTFRPRAATIEGCLKRWVEDGGEQDGVPLRGKDASRETYRRDALSLLGELFPKNEAVAYWVRSNMAAWSPALQRQAVSTLGQIRAQESFAFLKAKARETDGWNQEQIWLSLLLIDCERFAEEMESIAPTRDEQIAVGVMLMNERQPMVVQALQKLEKLVPEHTAQYEEYIEYIRKMETSRGEAYDPAK